MQPRRPLTAEHPPGASIRARLASLTVLGWIDRLAARQAAGGAVLVAAAALALAWANSPWSHGYEGLLATRLALEVGPWAGATTVEFLVDDVLMSVFFLVIGLEVRRSFAHQLSTLRRAAVPILAALGGMVVPAALYLLIAGGVAEQRAGWAIPVSTDTAFALGVLALLGPRVPDALRLVVLTVAIVDDILAVLIIATFYSEGVAWQGLAGAAAGVGAILLLQRLGVRRVVAYVVPAAVIWTGIWWAHVHPTIAGVIVGMLTPTRVWYGPEGLAEAARSHVLAVDRQAQEGGGADHRVVGTARELRRAQREAVSPLDRVETSLHDWAAFLIMPLFAFANAGVDLRRVHLSGAAQVATGIAVGLIAGKMVGILLTLRLGVALHLVDLPAGVTWRGLTVVAAVAGIGFTMALFIAEQAFADQPRLRDLATVAVLAASTLAALTGLVLGRWLLPRPAR